MPYQVNLLQTPFDEFKIPFTVEVLDMHYSNMSDLEPGLVKPTVEEKVNIAFNCHYNWMNRQTNMTLQENLNNLAEFKIDEEDCSCSLMVSKKKNYGGDVIYERSESITFWLSLYRVPVAMLINLFMPLVLLVTL